MQPGQLCMLPVAAIEEIPIFPLIQDFSYGHAGHAKPTEATAYESTQQIVPMAFGSPVMPIVGNDLPCLVPEIRRYQGRNRVPVFLCSTLLIEPPEYMLAPVQGTVHNA